MIKGGPCALVKAFAAGALLCLMWAMTQPRLSFGLTLLLAFVAGASVATIYLNQPLLSVFAHEFGAPPEKVGLISTFTQIGYGLGIFFLVPLGDTLARRRLVFVKLLSLAALLVWAALADSLAPFLIASVGIGILATAAQDMVVLTADLSVRSARGKAIGTVMSGLFMGVLISRTFSGLVAAHFGWRAVFYSAAVVQIFASICLLALLPVTPKREKLSYASLIKSMLGHIRGKTQLRNAVLTHGLVGMSFSAFWTCLAFHLSSPEFGLTSEHIGYFGLIGAAGTLAAPFAGQLVDKRGPFTGILLGTALAALSFVGMMFALHSVWGLAAGAFVFDLGLQVSLISHQTIVYGLDDQATSRLNAVFFTGVFIAFAIGSAAAVQVFANFGWVGVLALSAVLSTLAFLNGWRMSYKPYRIGREPVPLL